MGQGNEFSKWINAVEEALRSEGKQIEGDCSTTMPECGCGSWDCPTCFPPENSTTTGSMGQNQQVCSTCGHELCADSGHEPNVVIGGLETNLDEVEDAKIDSDLDELMQAPMEEEEEHFIQHRPSSGRGVKLGDIVRKTEYRKVGSESPLTHGSDNLTSEEVETEKDFDLDNIRNDHDLDAEEFFDLKNSILYMQNLGLSKSSKKYTEDEIETMDMPELQKAYQQVTGSLSETTQVKEHADSEIVSWMSRLNKVGR